MASPPAGAVACVRHSACEARAGRPDWRGVIFPRLPFLAPRDNPPPSAAARRISVSDHHPSKHQDRAGPRSARVALSPLGSGDHQVHLPVAALRTHEPLAPIENRRVRAVSSSHLGGVRARPGGRTPCTTRSAEREPQPRYPTSSAVRDAISYVRRP